MVLLSLLIGARAAESGRADDHEQKVQYLLNFTEYVEWPTNAFANAKSPIVIGVIGEDPFGKAWDVLEDKTSQGAHSGRCSSSATSRA